MSNTKKNDWIAINLNAPDTMSVDALYGYGITPDNTGLQSEDFYKSQKQVVDTFTDKNTGKFNEERFHAFYESAQRSYNDYQKQDFTQKLFDNIESSPYDIFSLGYGNIMDTSAIMYRSNDPQRTTMGLGNIYEVGTPTFDVREVAQANKARDEEGNVLDWSPNERGSIFKGLFRPTMVLATWDEDGTHLEKGIEVKHKAGDLKFDDKGDPFYEKLGNREMYGKETLRYWDTITRDDSAWNKIDFMDSDGLTKSVGKTIAKTALTLIPYFIPGVGEVLGWVGASVALGQTLPILTKAVDSIVSGTTDNGLGRSMTSIENFMDRFRSSQSRASMGNFFSFENLGDIISSSAGQLYQQRLIGQLPRMLAGSKGALQASKIGRNLSIGYMAATSATDTYSTFKEAGAEDAVAGIATLAYTAGLFGLMNINYFKDMLFTNTWLDEDIAMRDTMRQLVKETTIEPFAAYNAAMRKPTTELEKRLARTKLYKAIQEKVAPTWKKWTESLKEARPTVRQINNEASKGTLSPAMRTSMYLSRALNEGIEETMEEGLTDVMKGITLGLESLGVKVSKDDKNLDFGLSLQDMLTRYAASFVGGAIGGAVFESINQWEGGPYTSLLEKSLIQRLAWYERNGYDKEIRDRVNKMYRRGQLGNVNLSSKGKTIKSIDGKDTVVYGEGSATDNQNLFVYNVINSYLDRLNAALSNNGLFMNDNEIFENIWKEVREKHKDDVDDPEVGLYHFLENLDTAKALTIEQMGFLNAVKEDADALAYDIIRKDEEIKKVKDDIRQRNNITDANRSREEELFKNSQYLKTLEKERDDMKKAWDQILKGERNGYYMGYAGMMANSSYLDIYTNPNPSQEVFKNLQEVFPKTGIENWTKFNYGLEFNSITDEDLKKKIKDEYESYLALEGKDQVRKIYDMHIKFSEQFAPEITKLNETLSGKQSVNPISYFSEFLIKYGDAKGNTLARNAAANLLQAINEIDNSGLDENLAIALKISHLQVALNEVFPKIEGHDDTEAKLDFIRQLNQQASDDKVLIDTALIRNVLLASIAEKDSNRVSSGVDVYINNPLNERLNKLVEELTEDVDKLDAFISGLNENTISEYTGIQNYISAGENRSEEDVFNAQEDVKNILETQNPLLAIGPERMILLNKIKDVLDGISRNSRNVQDKYNDAINYLAKNAGLSAEDAKKMIDDILFPDGTNLVDFIVEQQAIERNNSYNAVEELLGAFDIYTGGKIYNALKILTDQEEYMNRLTNPEEYSITSKTIEKELETALSYLRVLSAIINSSLDGLNEQINLSRDTNKLAVTDPNLAKLYDNQILDLVNRINRLLETSKANRLKTTKAQQDTMINMNRLRVKSLTAIGSINFDGEVVDFAKMWSDTGFGIEKFDLTNAKDADKAFRAFQSKISNQLKPIVSKYVANNNISGFIKVLIDKFGTDVYRQDPGEFSDDPDTTITPYSNVTYLLTLAVINSDEFDSIWKTVTSEHSDLIPLSSQEYVIREAFASVVDAKEGSGLFDALHDYIKLSFPNTIAKTDPSYASERGVAHRFINIDGIGGTGKTTSDFLLDQCLKKYFINVSSTASSVTDSAAENLHSTLRLGTDNVKSKTVKSIIETVCKDKDGKVIFDFDSAHKVTSNTHTLNRDSKGNIVDGKGNRFSNISKEQVDALFNSKDGLRVIYIDESGLMTRPEIEFLLELAKSFDFFVIGSGDVLQNKATIKNGSTYDQTGIEDLVYHRTSSLTISMRSENNGKYKNTEVMKDILRTVSKQFFVDPSTTLTAFDRLTKDTINSVMGTESEITLIYSNSDMAGDQLIRSENVLDFSKKMLTFVKELSENETDPSKKHQLAIVTDDESKQNLYRNQLKEFGDFVVVIGSKSVQGREYDYVIVDKPFDKNSSYNALTDFYTMITRAKIGSAIVDDEGVIKSLGFDTKPDDTASEPVLGGDAESKATLFQEYSTWRRSLMEDIKDYTRATPSPKVETQSSSPSPSPSPAPSGSNPPTEIVINGPSAINDDLSEKLKDKKERDAYYTQQLLDGEQASFHQKCLIARNQKLKSAKNQHVDFDVFISELKDLDNKFFEEHSLSIANGKAIDGTDAKIAYRSVIATIARAILNNNSNESRIEFISSARDYLRERLSDAGVFSEDFIVDLQRSFNGDGFFVCNNGHIFYTFETEGRQVAIPIAVYTNPALDDSYFENLRFNTEVGSIPISTNGEVFVPVNDVVNEIDGVVLDEAGHPYVGVVTYTSDLKNTAAKFFNGYRDDSQTSKKAESAYGYLQRNNGKSMLAICTASKTFDTGDSIFSSQFDGNGVLQAVINKEYDPSNLAQELTLVGVQQITTIQDWFRATSILWRAVRHKDDVSSEDAEWISNYYGGIDVLSRFNPVNTDTKNIAANYRVLNELSVLNTNAVNGLNSAIFRFLNQEGVNKDFRTRFWQNFVEWLGDKKTSDDERIHRKGFGLTFKDTDGNSYIITVVPKTSGNGYDVLYQDSNSPIWKPIVSNPNDDIHTLFNGTEFNFRQALLNTFDQVNNSTEADDQTKAIIKSLLADVDSHLSDGSIVVFPIDLYTDTKDERIIGYYSPYETDIYDWMTKGDSGERVELEAGVLDALSEFLHNDSIFRNNLYRNIKASYNADSKKGWGQAQKILDEHNTYLDITKVIAPLYSILTDSKVDPDSEKGKELKAKIGSFFAISGTESGAELKIDSVTPPDAKGTTIVFNGGKPSVNGEWLEEFSDGTNSGFVEINSINLSNGNATLQNGKTVKLNEDGLNMLLSIPAIKSVVDASLITNSDKSITIFGTTISIRLQNGGTKEYSNAMLIGINNNTYTFETSSGTVNVVLSKEMADKLNSRDKAIANNRGIYLGTYTDEIGQTQHVYISNSNLYLFEANDPDIEPIVIPSEDVIVSEDALQIPNAMITNKDIINNYNRLFKSTPNFDSAATLSTKDMKIVFNSPIVDLEFLQDYTDDTLENGEYRILAFDGDRIGIYTNDDLLTFKWVNKTSNLPIKDDVPSHLDERLLEERKNNVDWHDPASAIQEIINSINIKQHEAFVDLDSDLDKLTVTEFKNGMFVDSQLDDIDIEGISAKSRRAIYKYLKGTITSEISDIEFFNESSFANEITVRFKVNGNTQQEIFKVAGDRVVPLKPEIKTTFDQIESDFNTLFDQVQNRFNEIQSQMASGISVDQLDAVQAEFNQVSERLNLLQLVKDSIKDPSIDKNSIIPRLKILDNNTKMLILKYYKANSDKSKC